jgi:UPF0176 protein
MRKFISKEELKEQIKNDPTPRTTLSLYRYVNIEDPEQMRESLLEEWDELGVLGRTYLAKEGINAQISMPTSNLDEFKEKLYAHNEFANIPFKIAVEDDGKSFYKNCIKVKEKIVADGLDDGAFDTTDVGVHLDAEQFNKELENGAICVDMRNQYESEIGHFEGAICPDVDTFREELPIVEEMLEDKKGEKILLYCTGGIRCEKASAYLKSKGFKDVNQLHGGIIDYKRQVDDKGLDCKFKGKNFVFDERLGERISDEIIANCHQCGEPCDDHTNCKNDDCHLLFIQCKTCAEKMEGCCTAECMKIAALPEEEQRKLRKQGKAKGDSLSVYKSRLRPHLKIASLSK